MKKKLTFTIILYIFTLNLFSQSVTTVGNSTNFENFKFTDIQIVNGEMNKKYLQLRHNEYEPTPNTDFLIHFNEP